MKKSTMTIAGLDPSGGAGIIADLKTFNSYNIYGTSVITALTAQNPKKVTNIMAIDTNFIIEQIDLIMDEYPIEYIKTGMLYSDKIIKVISKKIKEYNLKTIVDPVMVSESGSNLVDKTYIDSMKKYLLPLAYIITPNINEAEKLSNITIKTEEDMITTSKLLNKYTNTTIITGGHMQGTDILCIDDEIYKIKGNLIKSNNTHGTGCTYSSSITCELINNKTIHDAAINSKNYVKESIKQGYYNTPNQFWKK